MPVIEMDETPSDFQMAGSLLTPHADQQKFVSTWAVHNLSRGSTLSGFKSQQELSQMQPFGHGSSRALSGHEAFKDAKGKEHHVTIGGTELVEMIIDRESSEARDRWNAEVSRANVEGLKIAEVERQRRAGLKVNVEPDTIIKQK